MQRIPARRRYQDACGAAHGLDLVGDRWSLLVVRELMFGAKRFGEIRSSLPGISAKVLTERLEELQASSILIRRKLPPPASAQVYELTAWGYEIEPVFQTLGRWAARSPCHDPTLPLSPASLMLSFRTMLDREAAKGVNLRIGFRFGAETFLARIGDGEIVIVRGDIDSADVRFVGDPASVAAAVYGGAPLSEVPLRVEGNPALAERFVGLFALPAKAPAAAVDSDPDRVSRPD
ncbi:MAG: transcriptional regulator [Alphaproteobacteria bacterium]|nr:transcriptional regulator [Alphaproteobacteria bacterium]MBV9371807.1 transcriptional regulator [Alphaproteobacteria bacterium]MBV9901908.1 transcriptional regulator [Alphaproteobacteria bacterium]